MTEGQEDSPAGQTQRPQSHEWTEEQLKAFINEEGARVSGGERLPEMCRTVNSKVLVALVKQGIPGIVYTLQPDRHSSDEQIKFKTEIPFGWDFHSVGIVKLSESHYMAYDQVNFKEKGSSEFFFKSGTLNEISQSLGETFGSIWDLDFGTNNPDVDAEITVHGKIDKVKAMIEEGKLKDPKIDDVTPEFEGRRIAVDNKGLTKPLGLKFIPTDGYRPDKASGLIMRKGFTFKYA